MNRTILFRGKRKDTKEWIEGSLIVEKYIVADGKPMTYIIDDVEMEYRHEDRRYIEVIPETVGQFTGLLDKHGNKVFEGDVVQVRTPYRSSQTHEGDNIPNGSYTEYLSPEIRTEELEVVFRDGMFVFNTEKQDVPIIWFDRQYTIADLKEAVSCYRSDDIFCCPVEGDLGYLLEYYPPKTLDGLLEWISGVEIVRSIHDNPELLKH